MAKKISNQCQEYFLKRFSEVQSNFSQSHLETLRPHTDESGFCPNSYGPANKRALALLQRIHVVNELVIFIKPKLSQVFNLCPTPCLPSSA